MLTDQIMYREFMKSHTLLIEIETFTCTWSTLILNDIMKSISGDSVHFLTD